MMRKKNHNVDFLDLMVGDTVRISNQTYEIVRQNRTSEAARPNIFEFEFTLYKVKE